MTTKRVIWTAAPLALLFAGCSSHDPETTTPYYHVGTPTNRSSVNSWELNNEPYYTQPGVYHGRPVAFPSVPPSARYEPNDPVAQSVYHAIASRSGIPMRFITIGGHDGHIVLEGSVQTGQQRVAAEQAARVVPGVKQVDDELQVASAVAPTR